MRLRQCLVSLKLLYVLSKFAANKECLFLGDMLVTCVDLVKSRLGAMDSEARKMFILILAQLIEKSPVCFTLKVLMWCSPHLNCKFIFPDRMSQNFTICFIMPRVSRRGNTS
jgi:hypothetical protein